MKNRAIWYVGVGLLCLCMAALLVSASTTPKPRPGFNGPLALKQELQWLKANGLLLPAAMKEVSGPSSLNHRAVPPAQRSHFKATPLPFAADKAAKEMSKGPAAKPPMKEKRRSATASPQFNLSKRDPLSAAHFVNPGKWAGGVDNSRRDRMGRRTLDITEIMAEGFEGGVMPPTGWSRIIADSAQTWTIGAYPYEGTYSAECLYDPLLTAQDEWFISPSIDLSTVTEAECHLTFWWFMSYYWAVTEDNYDLELRVSTDGGATWEATVLWSEDGIGVFSDGTYYQADVDVSAYMTQTDLKFGWRYVGSDGDVAGVDAIRLYGRSPCITCSEDDSTEATETADSTWMASDPNGGCNNTITPLFDPVVCWDTLCGYGFTYETPTGLDYRDLDWYEFTLAAPETVSVWIQAEFSVVGFLTTSNCLNLTILAFGTGDYCDNVEFGVCLEAGTYYLIIAPNMFTGLETPALYRALLKCHGTCTPPAHFDCAEPYVLPTETGTFTGLYTCTAFNDYANTCLGWYDDGEDMILEWTVTTAGLYRIWLDPLGTSYTGIVVDDECPPAATGCLGQSTNGDITPHAIACAYYPAGTYYIMVDTWPTPDCIPAFNLTIETCSLVGACCYGDPVAPTCETDSLYQCQALNGVWHEGEDCATYTCPPLAPDYVLNGTGTVNGNTCGAGNDCNTRPSEDEIVQVNILSDGVYTFSLCNTSPSWDTYIFLDATICAATHIAENDDYCGLLSQITEVSLTTGTYYLLIEAFGSTTCGAWQLDVFTPPPGACCYGDPYAPTCDDLLLVECTALGGTWYEGEVCGAFTCPLPPANDTCGAAIAIGVPSTTIGTTTAAFVDDWAPYCVVPITSPGVWYKLTGTGTSITATTCNAFTAYDTRINVYCGSCEDLLCVTGNDDDCVDNWMLSTATWCSELGSTYYVLVHGFGSATGDFQLDVSEDAVPCEPTVICHCADPDSVTAYRVPTGVQVRFFAPGAGAYYVWSSTVKNNDGNPDDGLDANFALRTTLLSFTGSENLAWVDTAISGTTFPYKNYVVTSKCGPAGRCCYGPDPEDPLCEDVPRVVCDVLGGSWTASMLCATFPCICPPGSTPENEPTCYDEYVDVTNGGCNSTPYVFGTISCGETICGTSGTYLFTGWEYRDTDWFELVTTEGDSVVWSVVAEFDVLAFILNGDCDGTINQLASGTALAGQTLTLQTFCMQAGTFWLWVGPSVFTGVPCGSRWIGTATCIPCTPPPSYDCAAPYVLPTETGTFTGLFTCGTVNDYSNTCLVWYDDGEDMILEWTVTTAGDYRITLDPEGTNYTGIVVDDECPPAATGCLGMSTSWDIAPHSIFCQHYDAGTYYIMVDTEPPPDCIPSFNVTIAACTAAVCIPDFVLDGTGTVNGNTCGAINDCPTRPSEEQIVQVNLAEDGLYTFSLCATTPSWDTYLFLDATCCAAGHIAENDDYCGVLSQITEVNLTAGTYYVMIEGFGDTYCGAWQLDVTGGPQIGYCTATGGCDEYISQVQVGSIDNSSACSGYADYTAFSTTMTEGTGYAMTVTNGNPYTDDECGIWVDWNNDDDFDDAGEAMTVSGSPGNGPYTATITPPTGSAGTHRMRTRIVYFETPVPCGTSDYGEVEDYTFVVEAR